jgi:hypothetical protein
LTGRRVWRVPVVVDVDVDVIVVVVLVVEDDVPVLVADDKEEVLEAFVGVETSVVDEDVTGAELVLFVVVVVVVEFVEFVKIVVIDDVVFVEVDEVVGVVVLVVVVPGKLFCLIRTPLP